MVWSSHVPGDVCFESSLKIHDVLIKAFGEGVSLHAVGQGDIMSVLETNWKKKGVSYSES